MNCKVHFTQKPQADGVGCTFLFDKSVLAVCLVKNSKIFSEISIYMENTEKKCYNNFVLRLFFEYRKRSGL